MLPHDINDAPNCSVNSAKKDFISKVFDRKMSNGFNYLCRQWICKVAIFNGPGVGVYVSSRFFFGYLSGGLKQKSTFFIAYLIVVSENSNGRKGYFVSVCLLKMIQPKIWGDINILFFFSPVCRPPPLPDHHHTSLLQLLEEQQHEIAYKTTK